LVIQEVLVFIIEKTMVEMLRLSKLGITKIPTKLTKEKEKEKEREKEVAIYQKIVPLEALDN
jgi:hypothetical protein